MSRLPFLCWLRLHGWRCADDFGWLRYCRRCEIVQEDAEQQALATFIEAWINKDARPYIERIEPKHREPLERYMDGRTLWQRSRGDAS